MLPEKKTNTVVLLPDEVGGVHAQLRTFLSSSKYFGAKITSRKSEVSK